MEVNFLVFIAVPPLIYVFKSVQFIYLTTFKTVGLNFIYFILKKTFFVETKLHTIFEMTFIYVNFNISFPI